VGFWNEVRRSQADAENHVFLQTQSHSNFEKAHAICGGRTDDVSLFGRFGGGPAKYYSRTWNHYKLRIVHEKLFNSSAHDQSAVRRSFQIMSRITTVAMSVDGSHSPIERKTASAKAEFLVVL